MLGKMLNKPCAMTSPFSQRKRLLITALANKTAAPSFGKAGVCWLRTTWHKRRASLFLSNQMTTGAFMPSARSENDFSQPREDKVDCPTEG